MTSSQAEMCAVRDRQSSEDLRSFCSVATIEWLVLYINSLSYERLLSRLPAEELIWRDAFKEIEKELSG